MLGTECRGKVVKVLNAEGDGDDGCALDQELIGLAPSTSSATIKRDAVIDRWVADATRGTATADAAPLFDERLTSGRRECTRAGEARDPGADVATDAPV